MALLSDQQRREVAKEWAQEMSDSFTPTPILKAAVLAFIGACDDWADANQASFNSSLPAQARNNLTSSQKALGLALVVKKRHGVGV